MTDFATLKARFMDDPADAGSLAFGELPPAIMSHTRLTPLINGPAYFADFKRELASLDTTQNAFCYLHGWWLGESFSLDGESAPDMLTDLLKTNARGGVDVRAMGFVAAPDVMNSQLVRSSGQGQGGIFPVVDSSMRFLSDLRGISELADKAILNILNHPAGSSHLKMAILGDDTKMIAYTGGLDMENFRHNAAWEDVQLKIEGRGSLKIYDYFGELWSEIGRRSPVEIRSPFPHSSGSIRMQSHTPGMPSFPRRAAIDVTSPGTIMQSARTLPQFNFTPFLSLGLPTNSRLSFAPSGDFSIKKIWQKGISGARKYIYVEDQSFWGTEQSDWINAQIKAHEDLRVILLIGRWDPNDQAMSQGDQLFSLSINQHLLAGLNASQRARICFASRTDTTIHTKSTICDDAWGAIGSANYMIRSLYTDMESYVGFMEEDGQLVPNYRQSLWDMHFGAAEPDLDRTIDRWFNLSNDPNDLPTKLHRVNLPLAAGSPISDEDQRLIDAFLECDSRKNWGLDVARMGVEAMGEMDVLSE